MLRRRRRMHVAALLLYILLSPLPLVFKWLYIDKGSHHTRGQFVIAIELVRTPDHREVGRPHDNPHPPLGTDIVNDAANENEH